MFLAGLPQSCMRTRENNTKVTVTHDSSMQLEDLRIEKHRYDPEQEIQGSTISLNFFSDPCSFFPLHARQRLNSEDAAPALTLSGAVCDHAFDIKMNKLTEGIVTEEDMPSTRVLSRNLSS